VSPLPITWAEHVAAQGHWGQTLRQYMTDYVHWSCLGALCEFLPQPGNRVTLAAEKDRHGPPVAQFSYSQCDNDRQLMRAAQDVMERILRAAGADEVMTIDRYATWSVGRGWPQTNATESSIAIAAASPCRIYPSPTAASCRPRAAPIRL
jgi:GMC oxidoreductase